MSSKERRIAIAFAVSAVAGLGLAVTYVLGGQPQIEGILLALALGGLGTGLIAWARRLLPAEEIAEPREHWPSPPREQEAAEAAFERGERQIGRRYLLVRLLAAAAGSLGLAVLFPIRSLGPRPGRALFETSWRPGALVVKEDSTPVRASDLEVGSVITVFPEGHVGAADSQVLLIRVEPEQLKLPPERLAWAPKGYIAFSKICTHAGCPVGLYRAQTRQLLCPCHQSTFDVTRGAVPTFGPAVRALPQLPLDLGTDGLFRARGDFLEPVGPGFWNRS